GIEIDGFAASGSRTLKYRNRQSPSQPNPATARRHPQSLHLPSVSSDACRQPTPRDKSGRFALHPRQQAPTILLVIAERQPSRFLFKRAEAEPRRAGLRDHEPAILKQKFPRLRNAIGSSSICDFFNLK